MTILEDRVIIGLEKEIVKIIVYLDGKKALMMIKDAAAEKKIQDYLLQRYNLITESVDDILSVLHRVSGEAGYDLVILDEEISGLAPTSHALNNIKDGNFETNVLYLSTLHELFGPHWVKQLDLLPLCGDEEFRLDESTRYVHNRLAMHSPVMKATSMGEAYPIVCRQLMESFNPDGALIANLRLGVEPVTKGIVVDIVPPDEGTREEFVIEPTGYLRELITYFRPIHIPDLEKEPAFARELEEKFSIRCQSILLLPMQLAGKCVGFTGMYMWEQPRLFNIPEIDLSQRLADTAAAVLISLFFRDHINIKIPRDDEDMIS